MTTSMHHSSAQQRSQQHKPLTLSQGRYICQKTLGCGTYGRVLQCFDQKTNSTVAVKVSQKESAYTRAALVEYNTVLSLQEHTVNTVRVYEQFEERGHICIAMELLSQNLFELGRKRVESKGELLHVDELRQIMFCVLNALTELHRLGLMHCDIKPENIMVRSSQPNTHGSALDSSPSSAAFMQQLNYGSNPHCTATEADDGHTRLPSAADASGAPDLCGDSPVRFQQVPLVDWSNTCLIDYGAVRRLHENSYFDIQSMWYRAPEVLCHVSYTPQIDSWSMGCLLYEMYTGRPLFMGNDPIEQLQLIAEMAGSFPHLHERYPKLAMGKVEHSHENMVEILRRKVEAARNKQLQRSDRLHQNVAQNSAKSVVSSRGSLSSDGLSASCQYHSSLPEAMMATPNQMNAPAYTIPDDTVVPNSKYTEILFIDLMARLLCPDEFRRISCEDALSHPFFTSTVLTPSPENHSVESMRSTSGAYVTLGRQKFLGSPSFSSASGLSASPSLPSGFTNVSATNSSGNVQPLQQQQNQVLGSVGMNHLGMGNQAAGGTFSTTGSTSHVWQGNPPQEPLHVLQTSRAAHATVGHPAMTSNNGNTIQDSYYVTAGTRPILVPFANQHHLEGNSVSLPTNTNVEYYADYAGTSNSNMNNTGSAYLPQPPPAHQPNNNVTNFRSCTNSAVMMNAHPFLRQRN